MKSPLDPLSHSSQEQMMAPYVVASARRMLEVMDAGGPYYFCIANLEIAVLAWGGDKEAAESIIGNPSWTLDEDGELP